MNTPNNLRPRGDQDTTAELEARKKEEDEIDLFLSKVGTEYVEPPSDLDDDDFDWPD